MAFIEVTYNENGKIIEAVRVASMERLYVNQPLPAGHRAETLAVNNEGAFLVASLHNGIADFVWTYRSPKTASARHAMLVNKYGKDNVQTVEIQVA